MTPEQLHAAAEKIRATSDAEGLVRAYGAKAIARLLDRLAVDPERDPVEALNTPPQRIAVEVDRATGDVLSKKAVRACPRCEGVGFFAGVRACPVCNGTGNTE